MRGKNETAAVQKQEFKKTSRGQQLQNIRSVRERLEKSCQETGGSREWFERTTWWRIPEGGPLNVSVKSPDEKKGQLKFRVPTMLARKRNLHISVREEKGTSPSLGMESQYSSTELI